MHWRQHNKEGKWEQERVNSEDGWEENYKNNQNQGQM